MERNSWMRKYVGLREKVRAYLTGRIAMDDYELEQAEEDMLVHTGQSPVDFTIQGLCPKIMAVELREAASNLREDDHVFTPVLLENAADMLDEVAG